MRAHRFLSAAIVLLLGVAGVARADELADAKAFRAAAAQHADDPAWMDSFLGAMLGQNYKKRALAKANALTDVVKAADDAALQKVLARRGAEDFDALLSVAGSESGGFHPGTPLSPAALAKVDAVLPTAGEGTRPYRVESIKPPERFRQWLYDEQMVNDKTNNRNVFASLNQNDVPKELDPKSGNVFRLPSVEVPIEEASLVRAPGDPATTNQVIVQHDGKTFVRFFIHPLAEDYYKPLIKKYGLKMDFLATPTSSPRSLFVWDPYHPDAKPFIAKTSLPVKVGETRRMVPKDKIVRGVANSAAITDAINKGQLSPTTVVMPEEMGVMPPGFSSGMILRDIPDAISAHEWLPGFALVGHDGKMTTSRLADMIKKSGMDPHEFVNTRIIKPMLDAYAELALGQGLVGEPHQQNVLFEVGADGLPTGRVMFRDLDSYKVDVEARTRRGLTMRPFTETLRPTKMFKTGKGSDYYQDSYESYIREDIGFMIAKDLKKVFPDFDKARLYRDMDSIMGGEIKKFLGLDVNTPKGESLDVSEYVKDWKKTAVDAAPPAAELSIPQPVLKNEFERGVFNYRNMWIDSALAKKKDGDVRYLLHDGVVEMQVDGKTAGYTFLEPPTAGADFYSEVSYPRKAPTEARLAALYKPFDDAKVTVVADAAPSRPLPNDLAEPDVLAPETVPEPKAPAPVVKAPVSRLDAVKAEATRLEDMGKSAATYLKDVKFSGVLTGMGDYVAGVWNSALHRTDVKAPTGPSTDPRGFSRTPGMSEALDGRIKGEVDRADGKGSDKAP